MMITLLNTIRHLLHLLTTLPAERPLTHEELNSILFDKYRQPWF